MNSNFRKIQPIELSKAAIIPQSLDNQWVPKPLLDRMIKENKNLKDVDVKVEREKYVLKEWRRALTYGEQVVVNRAFMFNNAVVVDDYDDAQNREHFKELLNTGVIIPYLYTEESPDEKPANFDSNNILWNTWLHVVQETKMSCVRLDWNKQEDDFERLAKIYHEYIQTINVKSEGLAKNFGVANDDLTAFDDKLYEMTIFAADNFQKLKSEGPSKKYISRNLIYQKYVCEDGSNVADGYYSSKKPFAAAIKQIADLKYNVNLPDALGRYALTPEDSPPRAALGDLDATARAQVITNENVKEVLYSLRRLAFDHIAQGLFIKSLSDLSLGDVIQVRDTKNWKEYQAAMHSLLDNPLDFANRSAILYAKFESLNEELTRIKINAQTASWQPWVKFFITAGTKTIELLVNPSDPTQKYWTSIGTEAISTGATPFLMRMVISGLTNADADLEYSLDFMRGTIQNGRDTMTEIIGSLTPENGFNILKDSTILKHDATISQPE